MKWIFDLFWKWRSSETEINFIWNKANFVGIATAKNLTPFHAKFDGCSRLAATATSLLTLCFSITLSIGYSQISPENIILVYDSLNPNGKITLRSDVVTNLDSIPTFLLQEAEEEELTQIDSATLRKLLIGKWTLESVKRVNGIPFSMQSDQKIQFTEDGKFIIDNPNDTALGTWNVVNKRKGTLHFNYNEPQISIKDKEILKQLSQEHIESLTYSSDTKAIKNIDNNILVFITFFPQNTDNINNLFFRLILKTYRRDE